MVDTLNVVNYQDEENEISVRKKKSYDPIVEERVRQKIYERVSWSQKWKGESARKDPNRKGIQGQSFDQAFENKVHKSVVGRFLEDAKIPANQEVREAMIEILEYDWKSYTQSQWKKLVERNDFINDPMGSLSRAISKNETINQRWLQSIVTTLRLIGSGITRVGQSLKRFKSLVHLSLGGNEIEEIEGQHLPRDLRVLELAGNRISTLDKLVDRAPKGLIFLGLSRNCISDERQLLSISTSLHCLKVLDLEDNDLKNLTDVVQALMPMKTLRALILEGNPCATCLGYNDALLSNFPNLIYLDNVVIKPSDENDKEIIMHDPDKLSTGVLFMHVYRIMRLEKPPRVKKEKFLYFFEVDLPLLDAHRILREEMEAVREEFAKKGMEFAASQDNDKPKDKARADSTTAFQSDEFEWQEFLFFNEPILEIPPFDDDLKLLSDTFKSKVTVRLVRQKFPEDRKKKSQSKMNVQVKERIEICKFTCALKNMSWAHRSQDFSWTLNETDDETAKFCPPDTLPQQKYIHEDLNRGRKSTKNIHKQDSLLEKESLAGEPIPFPQKLTIHIGFGLRRFPDFDSIQLPLPTKGKIK